MLKQSSFWQHDDGLLVFDRAAAEAGIGGVNEGSMSDPRVHDAAGGVSTLLWNPYQSGYFAWYGTASLLDLDGRFPNGLYRITGTGTSGLGAFNVLLNLAGTYPDPPLILNYAQLRAVKPDAEVTVEWTQFVSAAPHRSIELVVEMIDNMEPVIYYSGPLAADVTSHTIPKQTFPKDARMQLTLQFMAASQFDANTGPGGAAKVAGYLTDTSFRYPAPASPPEPAVAFFGRDLFTYPGAKPDQSQWYFSYTYKNMYHFSGDNWFYFESFNAYLWVDIFSGTPGHGFWAYALFPGDQTSWVFLGRNGNFGDLRETPAGPVPDRAAGDQVLSGYLYFDRPLKGDPPGSQWYYFSEFADGNYLLNLGIPQPTPGDWHKVR